MIIIMISVLLVFGIIGALADGSNSNPISQPSNASTELKFELSYIDGWITMCKGIGGTVIMTGDTYETFRVSCGLR